MSISVSVSTYILIYICIHMYIYTHIYISWANVNPQEQTPETLKLYSLRILQLSCKPYSLSPEEHQEIQTGLGFRVALNPKPMNLWALNPKPNPRKATPAPTQKKVVLRPRRTMQAPYWKGLGVRVEGLGLRGLGFRGSGLRVRRGLGRALEASL